MRTLSGSIDRLAIHMSGILSDGENDATPLIPVVGLTRKCSSPATNWVLGRRSNPQVVINALSRKRPSVSDYAITQASELGGREFPQRTF